MMKNNKQVLTDMPIAGQSLTAELGTRPWQQPPKYNKPEEAIQHYFERLSDPEEGAKILGALEMGIPIETLTEAIQLSGVMEGLHTIDVGVLISPVIAESLEQLAKSAEIDYTFEDEDIKESEKPTEADVSVALNGMDKTELPLNTVNNMDMEEDTKKGLMTRRMM